jgi:hypothetical protein
LQASVPACTAAFHPHDFAPVDEAINSLTMDKIVSEAPKLVKDFEKIVDDYDNKNYEKVGADLGYIIQSLSGKKNLFLF